MKQSDSGFAMFFLALCTAYLLAVVGGVGTENSFKFPTDHDGDHSHVEGTYPFGTTMTLEWTTIWDTIALTIYQDGDPQLQYLPNSCRYILFIHILKKLTKYPQAKLQNITTFLWTVDISGNGGNPKFDLKNENVFFFAIYESGKPDFFLSQFVNFTSNEVLTSTSITSSSTSSSSPSSALSSSTTTAISTTLLPITSSLALPTSSVSSDPSTGLSSATKTGLGVGLGIGILALVAGFGIGYWFYGRRKAAAAEATTLMRRESASPPYTVQGNPLSHLSPKPYQDTPRSDTQIHEM